MRSGSRIIAVVPARSGSRGIPDKNLQQVGGYSLIARAAQVLASPECDWIDRRILSTDSERYAEEGRKYGLECPFLRPAELAGDTVGAVETLQHVWRAAEEHWGERYDVLLIVEPTCPLRTAEDVVGTFDVMMAGGAQAALAVSRLDTKSHPHKVLTVDGGSVGYYAAEGASIQTRQSLSELYYRNGACYAVSRRRLLEDGAIIGRDTLPYVIARPLANIDEPIDLAFARFLVDGETGS